MIRVAVLYVGSSLSGPLRRAEAKIGVPVRIATHDCTLPFGDAEWARVEADLAAADIVFVLHVTDPDNAARICAALDARRYRAVVVINCMSDLMRRTRMGKLDLFPGRNREAAEPGAVLSFLRKLGSWMSAYARTKHARPTPYLKFAGQLPAMLKLVPPVGPLRDARHYLMLFSYFLQPTPANLRSMIAYAIRHYVPGCEKRISAGRPESRPVVGIYHPDAPALFESFEQYRKWYRLRLDPEATIGLLLMRPQVVSESCAHADALIRALESEGVPVLPVLSTLMDNREACEQYLAGRVSQIVSLTGFSFVGGPAMNDSEAAVAYLKRLNRPVRLALHLEAQRIEDWAESRIGLNPVQTAMQVAIPEVDGVTEPLLLGGIRRHGAEPEPVAERCARIARRLKRWNRLRTLPREQVRLAFVIYCFPPNKGNLGTAADLDVFPSLWHTLRRLCGEGYAVEVPAGPGELRERLGIADRLSADDYFRLCPYVTDVEREWGPAPGHLNTQGADILIQGVRLGNALIAVQPTFGYEGDPMRLLMAEGGAPHHGFMGLYTYLDHVFGADALVHVGTHGALEFMPGKQVCLSGSCWPDRLIGEFPNLYLYSVNNPSEGSIAKRRSYATLISYLTPPVENAGLYKDLAALKELISAYRLGDSRTRERLFPAIREKARDLHLLQ